MPPKKIRLSITVIEGEDQGKVFTPDTSKIVIGRAGDISLHDTKVSRKHAVMVISNGTVFIKDLGSTNGIFVNDKKVEEAELKNLDEITLGFTRLSIAIVEDLKSFKEKNIASTKSRKAKKGKDFINIGKMIEDELSKFSRWDISAESSEEMTEENRPGKVEAYIEVIEGPDKGKKCKLKKGTTAIGRKKVDVALRDTDVSRTHAEVEIFAKDQMFVRDLASTNGTYINGKKVSYGRLKDGDIIQVGTTVLKFTLAE